MYNSQQELNMKSKNFGNTLRETREDGNISLRSLAKESGVDAAYLSRVERIKSSTKGGSNSKDC